MKRQLTDIAVKNAKPSLNKKVMKLSDSGGLYLLVNKVGKYWRYNYRYLKKQKTLAIGIYPAVSLANARIKHEQARVLLAKGIDPSLYKKIQFEEQNAKSQNTFEFIANEWFAKFSQNWSTTHKTKVFRILSKDVYPYLGQRAIAKIQAPEILQICNRIISRGTTYTAHKAKQICGQVFRYAVATGRASRDPTPDLKGALPSTITKHMAAITDPKAVGALMRSINGYAGHYETCCALKLLPLVFTRPSELRLAEWTEIDFSNAVWIIPKEKMKKRREHKVPLAKQSLKILQDMQLLTGKWQYIFPGIRSRKRPMSNNTFNAAFRRMGYSKDEITAHGLRTTASSLLNERGYNPDAIEAQLSHADRNAVRAAYNRAQYWDERVVMMQDWADYLDELRLVT